MININHHLAVKVQTFKSGGKLQKNGMIDLIKNGEIIEKKIQIKSCFQYQLVGLKQLSNAINLKIIKVLDCRN